MKISKILGDPYDRDNIYAVTGKKIAYWIRNTKVTPNQITIFRNLSTLIIYYLIYLAEYKYLLIAGISMNIWAVFDNVDGQLARLKKAESKFGGWMESTFDPMLGENYGFFGFFVALAAFRIDHNSIIWVILFFNILGYNLNRLFIDKHNQLINGNQNNIKENINVDKKAISKLIFLFKVWYNVVIYFSLILYGPIKSLFGLNTLFYSLLIIAVMRQFDWIYKAFKTVIYFRKNDYF
ncbi:CDP-alcohol phosphatidyltransferase family protein [candidate division KSB1 bacterium]